MITPPQVNWRGQKRVPAPFSVESGPHDSESGIHTTFAQSMAGAVLSAAHFLLDAQDPDVDYGQLLRLRLYENEARALLLEDAVLSRIPDEPLLRIVGVAVDRKTPEHVVVRFAASEQDLPEPGLLEIVQEMRWAEGDWKVVLSEEDAGGAKRIPSLSGYCHWAAP